MQKNIIYFLIYSCVIIPTLQKEYNAPIFLRYEEYIKTLVEVNRCN